jgi:integrase/recombinase XerD
MSITNKQNLTLEELIAATRSHLQSQNYSKDTLRHMDNCWSPLTAFAKAEGITHFTSEFGHRFLWQRYQITPYGDTGSGFKRGVRRSITILSDYQQCGIIYKRQPTKLHVWPDEYHEICEAFLKDVVSGRLAKGTQRQYQVHLERLMSYFIKNGVTSITEVTAGTIDGYFATYIGYAKRTIAYACYILKTFFKYALVNGYIKNDLVQVIPAVKFDNRSNLPSVFTRDEIERLILAVDRGNPQGKRDYAILLLAVRYGMRVGEITALHLDNLDFVAKKITYTHSKTGAQMSLDMLESIGWALIDYLKNARPKTDCTNVFVRLIAPYNAFGDYNNLSHIMQKYLTRAGIKQTSNKHYGMHTIRHSLASHLLEQGTPLHVISETLGHLELNSTMIYTKVDLAQLSLCALEVPNDTL